MSVLAADWSMLGSLADWTTAGIALFAFVVAGVAARYTAQTNRAQQETLELQRKQYDESHAGQIFFWNMYDAEGDYMHATSVANTSNCPIYQVALIAQNSAEVIWYQEHVMPTGHNEPVTISTEEMGNVPTRLYFKDMMGRRWIRDNDFNLRRVTQEQWHLIAGAGVDYLMGFRSKNNNLPESSKYPPNELPY